MRRVFLPALSLLLAAVPARADDAALDAALDTLREDCRRFGAEAVIEDAALRRIDVTGDGTPETLLDYTHAGCDGSPIRPSCGSGGCSLKVFAGGAVHDFLALDWRVYVWQAERVSRPVLLTYVRGYECDRVQAPCVIAWTWAGDTFVSVRPNPE